MATKAMIPFLVTMMLVTGVCNTILNKYQDMQCVRNCDSQDPSDRHLFEQPVIQTIQMFIGEMGCWLVVLLSYIYQAFISPRFSNQSSPLLVGGYHPVADNDGVDDGVEDNAVEGDGFPNDPTKPAHAHDERIRLHGRKIFLLAAPACCDIAGTTLMNVGLLFVAASIYQMTRGALVLFVGLFSVLFLHRKLYFYQWVALFVVVLGVALVGLAGALFGDSQNHDITREDAMAAVAHISMQARALAKTPEAVQAIIEEWILEHYAMDPIQVVGWEGVFGFSVTVIGSIILYLFVGRTEAGRYGYFDVKEGWHQVSSNRAIAISSVLIMISIGGFNFFGLSVTRSVSATSRSTIDTCRTLFIWLVSLALGWESFKWLQVAGFALLVYGTFLFNDIVRPPLKACLPHEVRERELLLPEEPIEHI
ncbi:putative nucleotide-sugar transporter [Aspergillus nomiae NRRL 13137]|uniref:Putative nucleotide-sugar transporter n=1 Tax=Aspergillus nomiae NRRL (strain ATCC 15546 / NRRL 13137 / CBS 260.88 / M93) TaxID=1509407 RepID=A0A0L1IUQ7_ASPN3|nr:putative nucleotide-sugar transporter [Aspergillus nomiae NRRL 13137]KNG83232.1 putative nucleotide-sugar transporter [Aspergillus nomiae NRRL 13137]